MTDIDARPEPIGVALRPASPNEIRNNTSQDVFFINYVHDQFRNYSIRQLQIMIIIF